MCECVCVYPCMCRCARVSRLHVLQDVSKFFSKNWSIFESVQLRLHAQQNVSQHIIRNTIFSLFCRFLKQPYNPNYKMFQNSYINLSTMFTVSQTQSNVINISITFETTCINYIKNRPTGCFKIRYIILPRCFSLSTLDQFFWSNLYNTPNYRVFSKRRSFKFAIITNNQRGTVKNLRKQYGGNDGD